MIETINKCGRDLIINVCDYYDQDQVTSAVTVIIKTLLSNDSKGYRMIGMEDNQEKINLLVQGYQTIHQISIVPVTLFESDGKAQKSIQSTLGAILLKTLEKDFHTVTAPCTATEKKKHSLDGETKVTCKNKLPLVTDASGNTMCHTFSCEFHSESLGAHLAIASICNALMAISRNASAYETMLATFVGLYHDVGKPLCTRTYEFPKTAITGYPAHDVFGAMIFQAHWTDLMSELITKEDFFATSETINRHMCGYHGDQDDRTMYKRDLLTFESQKIKLFLTYLRVGDQLGKVSNQKNDKGPAHFLEQQKIFEELMTNPETDREKFDFVAFCSKYGIKSDKIIIFPIGTSGSGKSYWSQVMAKRFLTTIVSRDCCIANICVGINERLESSDYQAMYQIYQSGKEVSQAQAKLSKAKGEKENKNMAKQLENALAKFSEAQTNWNTHCDQGSIFQKIPVYQKGDPVPDISGRVRDLWITKIQEALTTSSNFVILDTMMNCFPMAIDGNVPEVLSKYFRVHVHIQSFVERHQSNVGGSVEEQLIVSGPYGLDNPVHPDGMKRAQSLKAFASLSSELQIDNKVPKTMFKSVFRPHYVICLTRTPAGDFGTEKAMDCFRILNNSMMKQKSVHVSNGSDVLVEKVLGVDPETKDMNSLEFYQWLIKKYRGNNTLIKEHLRTCGDAGVLGFGHHCVIQEPWETLTEEQKTMYCANLSNYSKDLYEASVTSTWYTPEQFYQNGELREKFACSVVLLKYFEQFGPRFWKNKWAKEMRGIVLFVNPETSDVRVLSYKLPRGAEVLTGVHTSSGINDTQDIQEEDKKDLKDSKNDSKNVSERITKLLDPEQVDTTERLVANQPIKAYLTSKGDGSLLVINCYTGIAKNIMLAVVKNFGNQYTNLWASQSLAITNGHRLLVPSTQGTVMDGGFMTGYMTTSMLVGSRIVERSVLEQHDRKHMTATDCWARYGEQFIRKFLEFTFFDDLTMSHSFSFEAMCYQNRGLFGDKLHTELAITYNRDRLVFLGTSLCDRRYYIPHPIFGQISTIPFEEPLWWNIDHSNQIQLMMQSMEQVIIGKMTESQFLEQFPASNTVQEAILDYEGWVIMKVANYPVTDPDHVLVSELLRIVSTVYSKIKTVSYYKSHKFHMENIPFLVELAKTAGHIFPMARKVADMFSPNALSERLRTIGVRTVQLLDFKNPENQILERIKQQYEQNIRDVEQGIKKGKIPKNPLEGFEKRPFGVQCRLALNNDHKFGNALIPLYHKEFPEMDVTLEDLGSILKGLTMALLPWENGYEERIRGLDPTNKSVQGLVVACLGRALA